MKQIRAIHGRNHEARYFPHPSYKSNVCNLIKANTYYYSRAFQLELLERPSVNTKLGSGKIRTKDEIDC